MNDKTQTKYVICPFCDSKIEVAIIVNGHTVIENLDARLKNKEFLSIVKPKTCAKCHNVFVYSNALCNCENVGIGIVATFEDEPFLCDDCEEIK